MPRNALACALAGALFGGDPAPAQTQTQTPGDDVRGEVERLRRELDALQGAHERDQERIDALERELRQIRLAETAPLDAERAAETQRRLDAAMADASARDAAGGGGLGEGNQLNPQIAVFFDMGYWGSTSNDPAFNRFNLREVELDLRAAVTPWADGVLIIAIPEEIEETSGGGTEITTSFEIEEAYLNAHTIPGGFAIKGGKFRDAFGRNNLLHTHDLPQVDRPLAVNAFFGPEFSSLGAQMSWLVPNPWDKYVELIGEVVNAQGGAEGAPVLGGPEASDPAVLAHLTYFDDVGAYGSLDLGASYLYSQGADTGVSNSSTYGLDATFKWIDPAAPDRQSLLFQGEAFWNTEDIDGAPAFDHESFGFYAFAQYQFDQNWYVGVRYDQTEFPDLSARPAGDLDWAISPYLTWYFTEFLRFRFEYQHLEQRQAGDWTADENFYFQLTFVIGSHPAHPYWVNR